MFRVRLASGEEAVYRSVDELVLGIQSGTLTSGAEIFHGKAQTWLPIANHPEFELAVERAAGRVATEDPPAAAVDEARGDGIPQVYQMFSRSAREIAERRRPRWHARLGVSLAGLAVVAAAVVSTLPGPPVTDEAVLPRGVIRAPSPQTPGPRATPLSEQERRALLAPYNLATRFARARESASSGLADSAAKLGLAGVIRVSRLESADSLRRSLAGLAALRTLIGQYRAELDRLQVAYGDSAQGLIRAGRWSRAEAQEWRARVLWPEPPGAAARADTLLVTLARLHSFLISQPTRVNLASGGFIPGSDSAAATYDRLRADLTRLRQLRPERQGHAGVPLLTLLSLLGTDTLPERRQP